MRIQVLDLGRLDTGLAQCLLHGTTSTIAIFRAGGHVIGVGTGAVADQFGEWRGTTGQGMFQLLDHQQAGTLAHDKTITGLIEGPGSELRRLVVITRKRPGRRKTRQADPVDARFRATADRHVDLSRADHPGRIADGLDTCGTGGHRRTQWPLETVADRDVTGRHIAEKRRNGERRQTLRSLAVRGAHRFGNGGKTTDTRGNDGCRAFLRLRRVRSPAGLGQGLIRRRQGEQDEAVHLALLLGGQQLIRIEAGLRVLGTVLDLAADTDRQVADQLRRQLSDTGLSGQQALPDLFDSTAQRGQCAHAGDDDAFTHDDPTPSVS